MGELETATGSQGESPFAAVQTPRLSILHLMLWTLCSAIYLTLIRAIYALQGDMPSGYAAIRDASSVIQGIITGAVFGGTIVLVSTRVRSGPPMLRHPGHWFLFISAILDLIYLPFAISLLLLKDSGLIGTSYFVIYGVIFLFPPIAYVFAAHHNRARRWKVLFVGLAVVALAQCLDFVGIGLSAVRPGSWFGILSEIRSWGTLLLAGAVLAVSVVDLVAGQRRDWLHWTGVTTHVTASSVTVLWMIGPWFIR